MKFYNTLPPALMEYGFSALGARQLSADQHLTDAKDRAMLRALLTKLFVAKESGVPVGLPGPLRGPWKQVQP